MLSLRAPAGRLLRRGGLPLSRLSPRPPPLPVGVVSSLGQGLHSSAPRTTYVFERTTPLPPLSDDEYKRMDQQALNRRMRDKEKENEVRVLEEEQPVQPVKLILVRDTIDFGRRGQILTVSNPAVARNELLLPGAAVYATEENLDKYADIAIPEESRTFSSPHVEKILPYLVRLALPVSMNMHNAWTLTPSHLVACFRRLNYEVAEECIEMPPWEINGPNLDNEQKEFVIHVTINRKERVPVRCVLHHTSPDAVENEKYKLHGWQHVFHEPLFEQQRQQLAAMPRNPLGPKCKDLGHMRPQVEKYESWREVRNSRYYGHDEDGA